MGAVAQESHSLGDKIGKMTFEQVKSTMGIYEDEELLTFVKSVGKKLEAAMPKNDYDFKYYLVDVEEPNAFATAGGYVFVTRGLLAIIDTEDELAGVLGHEFNHVLLKHSEKKLGRSMVPVVLELPGNLVGSLLSKTLGELMNNPIKFSSEVVGAAFDRGQENQADKGGVKLAADAGYDPTALVSALTKLDHFVMTLDSVDHGMHLFDDHPVTAKRVENLHETLGEMDFDSTLVQRSLLPELDGLLVGQNPKNGVVLEDNLFLHPDMNFSYQLPAKWSTKNTPASLTASNSKEGAALVLTFDGEHQTPKEAYKAYTKDLNKKGLGLIVDKKLIVNGMEGIELTVEHYDGREEKTVLVWLKMEGAEGVLQFTGSGKDEAALDTMNTSIRTFRTITEEERARVFNKRLRYEKAPNETLGAYAKRKGMEGKIEALELINNVDADQKITSEYVKYLEKEPYQ
ncbi:hypothetical protein BFP72_01760 [Reichenbachiella sp. 5M10]|nr:hypothetical protein BFP72_01760 [Reichenbachiella sp. 5M10]